MSWYGNSWIVGIVSGIPSGIFVNWISRYTLGRRENREYLQKTIGANREVIYALRPGISENQIPTPQVLGSLINSTARRYSVEPKDLYTPQEIAEELVKEVMDSSFISSAQKAEFCGKLAQLRSNTSEASLDPKYKDHNEVLLATYRIQLTERLSTYLGFLTTVLAVVFSVFGLAKVRSAHQAAQVPGRHFFDLLPALLAVITVALTTAIYPLIRDFRKERERRKVLSIRDQQLQSLRQRAVESVRRSRAGGPPTS